MSALETRTEHETAAAAAVKARAALTPRSTSAAQAHYDELRQKGRPSVRHQRDGPAGGAVGAV